MVLLALVGSFLGGVLGGCKRAPQAVLEAPAGFPEPVYYNELNPITEEGIALGRRLFYDPILSADSTLSCASCHLQESGFSDPGMAISVGIDGRFGMRNSPALTNQWFFPYFMSDGGVLHLEVMPITPMTDENEMGATLHDVVAKLNRSPVYSVDFAQVFEGDSITSQQLLWALAQFQSAMISSNSTWDQVQHGEATFTAQQEQGWQVFQARCASCHRPPLFTDFSFANIGLDSVSEDYGRQRITMLEEDRGKFKVPHLRNSALSHPYMHDGRFETLEDVLAFYGSDVHSETPNLDSRMGVASGISEVEQQQLLAFLQTLTDTAYLTDPSLSNPF